MLIAAILALIAAQPASAQIRTATPLEVSGMASPLAPLAPAARPDVILPVSGLLDGGLPSALFPGAHATPEVRPGPSGSVPNGTAPLGAALDPVPEGPQAALQAISERASAIGPQGDVGSLNGSLDQAYSGSAAPGALPEGPEPVEGDSRPGLHPQWRAAPASQTPLEAARRKLYELAGGSLDSGQADLARLDAAKLAHLPHTEAFRDWVASAKAQGKQVFWATDLDKTMAAGDIFTFYFAWRAQNGKFTEEQNEVLKRFLLPVISRKERDEVKANDGARNAAKVLELWKRSEEGRKDGISLLDFWRGAYWPSQVGMTVEEKRAQAEAFAPEYAARIFPGVREINLALKGAGVEVVIVSNGDQELARAVAPLLGMDPRNTVGATLQYGEDGRSTGKMHTYESYDPEQAKKPQAGKLWNFYFWVNREKERWPDIDRTKIVIAAMVGDSAAPDGGAMLSMNPALGFFMVNTPGEPGRLAKFIQFAKKYGGALGRGSFVTVDYAAPASGAVPETPLFTAKRAALGALMSVWAASAAMAQDFGSRASDGPPLFRSLIERFQDGDPAVLLGALALAVSPFIAWGIAGWLKARRFMKMDVIELRGFMGSPKWSERRLAVRTFIKKEQGEMVSSELLNMAERDERLEVRLEAIESLGNMELSSARQPLERILKKEGADMQEVLAAALSLTDIADPRSAPAFYELVAKHAAEDGDTGVLEAGIDGLLAFNERQTLERLGTLAESELVERIRTDDDSSTWALDVLMDRYETIVDELGEDDKPSGGVFEALSIAFAQVKHKNAAALLQESLNIIREDEDTEHYTTTSYNGKSFTTTHHTRDADADETVDQAEDVLEPAEETRDWIEGLEEDEFRRAFGGRFKGHDELLKEAAEDSDLRLNYLLYLDATPSELDALAPKET